MNRFLEPSRDIPAYLAHSHLSCQPTLTEGEWARA
jgi:hypothetical protein